MSSLAVFEFGGQSIRATGDGRFSVYDVLVAFGCYPNQDTARITFKRILDKYSEVSSKISFFKFSGRGQRETPVATQEVCEEILRLLGRHPDQATVTSDKFYPRTEAQIISVLSTAFADLQPIEQLQIHGYKIDLYLAKTNVAIEIDEHGHKYYQKSQEKKREQAIKSALGCSFVRFDPYSADFNLGNVIFKIRGLI